MFDGSKYLVIVDYYSKMPIVRKMPTSQCNSAKTITVLKELFAEHGIPEEILSDNGPQLQVTSLQNSLRTGTLSTVHLHQGTPGAMDRQSPQSRLLKDCSPMQVLWTGSISCFVSIQEYPSWFSPVITCWDALSMRSTHNHATKDQAQRPLCSSWTWKVRGTCNPRVQLTMTVQVAAGKPHSMQDSLFL